MILCLSGCVFGVGVEVSAVTAALVAKFCLSDSLLLADLGIG